MKIDQNKGSEQILALLEGVEGDLGDDIDELMNDSDTEFVFEKEDSEEDAFLITNVKIFSSVKQAFTLLTLFRMEGQKGLSYQFFLCNFWKRKN